MHVLTPEHGKVGLLAKGAYRPKSAYSGVLDLFDTLDLTWRSAPGADLGVLSEGSITNRRRNVARDLDRYRAALEVLELAGLGARERHEERELFSLAETALDSLHASVAEPRLVATVFDLKLLGVQGVAPALSRCAECGRVPLERASSAHFSAARGGRLCGDCAAADAYGAESIPAETLRVVESLLTTPFPMLHRVRLDSGRTERVRGFVHRFLEYHLETRPRAWGPGPKSSLRRRRHVATRSRQTTNRT